MSQGLFTAVSGLKTNQAKLDVIADNIANMNTAGFKSSQMTFENVFSNTLSSGSAPQSNSGGINPIQIGLGVSIGDISRNFSSGTVQTTGRSTDMNIQGEGFFTLQNSTGAASLTRAGNFTLDSEGNLVNAKGLKVVGTDSAFSNQGSSKTILIPPLLKLTVSGNDAATTGAKDLSDLNNVQIKDGTFSLTMDYDDGTGSGVTAHTDTFTIASPTTLNDIATAINDYYNTTLPAAGATIVSGAIAASVTSTGQFSIDVDTSKNISNPVMTSTGTSNFMSETQLSSVAGSTSGTITTFTGKILDYKADVAPPDVIALSQAFSSFSVGTDGSIEATYANGDKITVVDNSGQRELVYKTASGVTISNSDISVTAGVIEAANLQLQIAKVINPKGLVSEGGNSFTIGPNAGEPIYSAGNDNGVGKIYTNGLESSNVDISSEFADMVLAQRAIEANSRTFDAQNQIMRQILTIGR